MNSQVEKLHKYNNFFFFYLVRSARKTALQFNVAEHGQSQTSATIYSLTIQNVIPEINDEHEHQIRKYVWKIMRNTNSSLDNHTIFRHLNKKNDGFITIPIILLTISS